MSPRNGRPPSVNPKNIEYKVRLTAEAKQRLDYCSEILGISKAEIIRQGIDEMFAKAQKEAKK